MAYRQITLGLLLIVSVISLLYTWFTGTAPEVSKPAVNDVIYIEKVMDGDTVQVTINGKREQVRLIGIDAPELGQRPWGKRSKKFLEDLVAASGWQARIEYDIDKRDKFDRVLAYLWDRGNKLLNEEILGNGYAVLFTFPPNVKHVDRLKAAQVIARENKRGIWGKDGLKQLPSDYRKEHPRK